MKRAARKTAQWLACLALVLCLCGCSMETSAENLFTLPQIPVEYTGLSNLLNTYLEKGYEYTAPTGGSNLRSLQMVDLDGDGEKEAVAFFRRESDEKQLKILVFRADQETGAFAPYCTVESGGTSIDSISFRDFNGDGWLEVAVGWRVSSEVQTVAVYSLRDAEAKLLMQSGYVRCLVDDLDGDGLFDLLLVRSGTEGGSIAEHYVWEDGEMTVGGTCRLSCTVAELGRGSMVCGKLDSKRNAAFITGVGAGEVALTDILICRNGDLFNVGASWDTGVTEVQYPFSQLRPQDINGDGIIEIPYPVTGASRQQGKVFSWFRFDARGNSAWVVDTFHNLADNWYLSLNDEWHGKLEGTRLETTEKGTCATVRVDGEPVLYLYSFSGEQRERDAQTDGRVLLTQRANVAYGMRITESGIAMGISNEWVHSHFRLISVAWTAGN